MRGSAEPGAGPAESAGTAGGSSVGERLRELVGLHADGILTDEEFTAVKAKLLGGF
ncbi:SHOCT domain-containing protein [Mycetocola zhadangensis]|uniref:SHOCT domain-containing protein n=1 Tax=Mycetocola zhadangensis TaxID=1164595 RepID=UPI003A4D9F83